MDHDKQRPINEMSPEEIERQIDELESELSRDGGAYETLQPKSAVPWYRRLWDVIFKSKSQENLKSK